MSLANRKQKKRGEEKVCNRIIEMGEYVKYRGHEVKIGTCENLYYTSYQKYLAAMNSGFVSGLQGNGAPMDYLNVNYGFRFRFPFPDEDKLKFGEIIEPFHRGVIITVSSSVLNDDPSLADQTIQIEIVQQKPVINEENGDFNLALVFRDPKTDQSYSIRGAEDIRKLVVDIVRNHVVNQPDPHMKSFYRAIAVRIIKGYGMSVLKEYKEAVNQANKDQPRGINKGLNKRGI